MVLQFFSRLFPLGEIALVDQLYVINSLGLAVRYLETSMAWGSED